jgi:PAS domain S-box-containing protein
MIEHAETLLEQLPLVTYRLRLEAPSPTVYVSPQVGTMFGVDPRAFAEDNELWTNAMLPEDRARFLEALEGLREHGGTMAVEYRVRTHDAGEVWVRDVATVEDGHINGYLVDITREKELEDELAIERATLDAFFARSRIGLGITDADGRYVRINEALARINGGSPGDFVGRTLAETRPDLAARVDPLRTHAREDGEHEIDLDWADGPLHALLSYFTFETGGERYVGRVVVDLTEQRRAQQAETLYRQLIEQLPLVAYVNDIDPRLPRYVSPQIEELTGYSTEQFMTDQRLGDRIIHPDDFEEITALEKAGDVFEHEYRIVRADGTIRWVLDRMETVRDEHGNALYEQGFLVDITERHDTTALLRAVWDGALEAMVILDDEGSNVDANPAALELFGRARDEMVGLRGEAMIEGYDAIFAAFRQSGKADGELSLFRPDGTRRDVEYAARANVMPGRHLAVVRDVTERKQLEAEVWRAQKLESVGRLAGGVAHDFNNLLTAVRGYAQLLQTRLDPGSVEQHHAQEIDRAADRAAALTAQLLALGRRQTLRARPLDLNRHVEEHADALVDLAGARIDLVFDLEPALRAVRADGPLLAQAIANIVANAAEAMPEGGRIVVRTRNLDVHGREDLADGSYVVLSVEDTGPGLDEATLEHVFEPFFTTKEVGSGTGGLGLASAYGTVTQSGGTITAVSELGTGTIFSIYLPEATAAGAGGPGLGDGETILLVERDPAVRDVAFELLTDASYRVLTARTTADAVRLAERYDGAIDLLFSDLDELRRRALVDLLRARRPELRSLTVAKPYTPNRLRAAVRSALGSPIQVTEPPTSV